MKSKAAKGPARKAGGDFKMETTEVIIRKMRQEDTAAVSRLESEVFTMPWSESAFREMAQEKNAIYVVAVYRDTIIGNCGVRNILGEGEITNVAVSETYRGHGVAKMMFQMLLAEGKKQGIDAFTLEVRKSNLPAIRLYESFGFESAGVRPRFYEKPVEDALVMWKR